ncbi:MAG: c-type cytochrome [Gammaproteobacteria bacterium]|nr:c-type cytochrome [Gammaproteobacteria bacterium]
MFKSLFLRALLTLLLAASLFPAAAAPDGRELYIEHCSACHQIEGQGGIGLPLPAVKLSDVSDAYLHKTIRVGRPGRVMPAFERLSDAQVDAIVRFLRQRTQTADPGLSTEAVSGDAENGLALYTEHCTKCHADDGSGEGSGTGVTLSRERSFLVMPASISNRGFLESASDHMIRRVIESGRKMSGMPAFGDGKLSDSEINDLVAYVRSFEGQQSPPESLDADERPTHIYDSPHDFETTLANVKAALTGANFRIFPDRLLEQGLIDEFSVNTRQVGVRFCNFNVLYGMLKIEPRLGIVLPCRITVIERADGSVTLAVPNLRVVSRWFNNDELVDLWDRMEETFVEIIEEVTL